MNSCEVGLLSWQIIQASRCSLKEYFSSSGWEALQSRAGGTSTRGDIPGGVTNVAGEVGSAQALSQSVPTPKSSIPIIHKTLLVSMGFILSL